MIRVTENFRKIQDLLAHAEASAGRPPGSVRLLAVSKNQPVDAMLELAEAGQREFGENVVQDALPKIDALQDRGLIWHFVGRLQSNKTREVAERFAWVHSVDRMRIARRLSEQRPKAAGPLNVCLQVNVDEEEAKGGVGFGELQELASAVAKLPNLCLRGLMCLPALREDSQEQKIPFRRLRAARDRLNGSGHELDTLSMGMSGDFAAAIEEGATIVRIGTALFGPRNET